MTTYENESVLAQVESQFNLRQLRPDFEPVVWPQWQLRSEQFRQHADCTLDVAYGNRPRERLDVFRAGVDAPVLVFFHGGYWQRGDKSAYSFVAPALVKAGVSVVLINYDLCPTVTVEAIVAQARRALRWLWRQAPSLGLSTRRLHVGGHSAGAHLAAMLAQTDWSKCADGMPSSPFACAVLISGLYDLTPICHTSLNVALGLELFSARSQSPLEHISVTGTRMLLVCGASETPGLVAQTERYAQALVGKGVTTGQWQAPGCDHFEVLESLASPNGSVLQQTLEWMGA